jgi:hypothetical protein
VHIRRRREGTHQSEKIEGVRAIEGEIWCCRQRKEEGDGSCQVPRVGVCLLGKIKGNRGGSEKLGVRNRRRERECERKSESVNEGREGDRLGSSVIWMVWSFVRGATPNSSLDSLGHSSYNTKGYKVRLEIS